MCEDDEWDENKKKIYIYSANMGIVQDSHDNIPQIEHCFGSEPGG